MYQGIPTEHRSDYFTGRGILEWRQGEGYTRDESNPIHLHFSTHQARSGWIRKIQRQLIEGWSLYYDIGDGMSLTAWVSEDR